MSNLTLAAVVASFVLFVAFVVVVAFLYINAPSGGGVHVLPVS